MTTAFVLVTDIQYLYKAKTTINDLRTIGHWFGDIVLITIGFQLDEQFKSEYNIIEKTFDSIDKTHLSLKIGPEGFENSDKRELYKLNQWEKLHVFDPYFLKWDRIVFLDAGLRVLDNVKYVLELDYKNKILAPINGTRPIDIFTHQLDHKDADTINLIKKDFGDEIFNSTFMLNCMWVYDTNILHKCDKTQLINAMNTYTVCRTNEMGVMNLMYHFKYHLWEKFPTLASNGKYLFEWCDLHNQNTTWQHYCFIKYPVTISLDQQFKCVI